MSTVPAPAPAFNLSQTYARPGGHPDPRVIDLGPSDDFDFGAELEALHHEQSIDFGDDAVNADAASAEATLYARFPAVEYSAFTRRQRRYREGAGNAGDFEAVWEAHAKLGGVSFVAIEEPTADAALACVLRQLGAMAGVLSPSPAA